MLDTRAVEYNMANEIVETHKSAGTDQRTVELMTEGSGTIRCEIHKPINSIWNKEEFPEEWKESIIYQCIRRVIKIIVMIEGYHVCQLVRNFYPTFSASCNSMCRECY